MAQREHVVAVVGAGLAGLVAARELVHAGLRVRVFEKARGPGGRIATRRTGPYAFDIGAQYFTVRGPRVQALLAEWLEAGVVAPWRPRLVTLSDGAVRPCSDLEARYVGLPRMSALSRHLAKGLDVHAGTRVTAVRRVGSSWALDAEEALGVFDAVLVATPPEQAVPLLSEAPDLARAASAVRSVPCWAAMAVFAEPLTLPFDAAFVQGGPLAWVARNASKPGRSPDEAWVFHATNEWSREHLDDAPEDVSRELTAAFLRAAGCTGTPVAWFDAHRWALASAAEPSDAGALWDADLRIGACGDWCAGRRVEAAVQSGLAAGERVVGSLAASVAPPA